MRSFSTLAITFASVLPLCGCRGALQTDMIDAAAYISKAEMPSASSSDIVVRPLGIRESGHGTTIVDLVIEAPSRYAEDVALDILHSAWSSPQKYFDIRRPGGEVIELPSTRPRHERVLARRSGPQFRIGDQRIRVLQPVNLDVDLLNAGVSVELRLNATAFEKLIDPLYESDILVVSDWMTTTVLHGDIDPSTWQFVRE